MRRIGVYVGVGVLTFICGVVVDGVARRLLRSDLAKVRSVSCRFEKVPRFVAVSSLIESDYHIYWYRPPKSDDLQQITLFADFRSREVTTGLFESNASTDAANVIEIGTKFDDNGHKIGKRGVTRFKGAGGVRIFWTDGDAFWSVQAPSLELAREFEQSAIVRSITTLNKRPPRTRL